SGSDSWAPRPEMDTARNPRAARHRRRRERDRASSRTSGAVFEIGKERFDRPMSLVAAGEPSPALPQLAGERVRGVDRDDEAIESRRAAVAVDEEHLDIGFDPRGERCRRDDRVPQTRGQLGLGDAAGPRVADDRLRPASTLKEERETDG